MDDLSSFNGFIVRWENTSSILSILGFSIIIRPSLLLLLESLIIGFSKVLLEEVLVEGLVSIFISILSNCLPIVLRHWLVYLFCSITF